VYIDKNSKSSNTDNNEKNNIIKTNFIIKTFINQDIIQKFLFKYFKIKKNNWDDIHNHIDDLIGELDQYIINIIKLSNN